jgi:hypothetical protein
VRFRFGDFALDRGSRQLLRKGELRTALGDEARHPRFIRTGRGFRYAFSGEALDVREEGPSHLSPGSHLRLVYRDHEVALQPGENALGRCDEAVAWIDSPFVSRRHGRILVSGATATREDVFRSFPRASSTEPEDQR